LNFKANGLRHGDHQRYRQYCTRKLRRVRKQVKLMYGRKKQFKFVKLEAEMCQSLEHLFIPLIHAERSWSYAMQLREQQEQDPDQSRFKFHMLRKLKNAKQWSRDFASLCVELADDRTALEAKVFLTKLCSLLLYGYFLLNWLLVY
jgi:signal recognition particle subunit SRP68